MVIPSSSVVLAEGNIVFAKLSRSLNRASACDGDAPPTMCEQFTRNCLSASSGSAASFAFFIDDSRYSFLLNKRLFSDAVGTVSHNCVVTCQGGVGVKFVLFCWFSVLLFQRRAEHGGHNKHTGRVPKCPINVSLYTCHVTLVICPQHLHSKQNKAYQDR